MKWNLPGGLRLSECICHGVYSKTGYASLRILDCSADYGGRSLRCTAVVGSSSFPRTFAEGHISGTFFELFSATAYNYTSGRLEFHDRRTRPPIKEPMLGARSLPPGHVRDFSSRVIFRGCAARVGMSVAGTQTATKGYVLPTVSPRYFFPLRPPLSPLAPFLASSGNRTGRLSACRRYSALKACHVARHNRPNRSRWTLHTTRGVNMEMIKINRRNVQTRETIMARTRDPRVARATNREFATSLVPRALFLFLLSPLLFQAPSDAEARDILAVFVVAVFSHIYIYTLLYEMHRVAVA